MQEPVDRLIIAGAGQAGYWVAATVRQLQPERPIVLIGEEPHPPYERPPLSKAVLTGRAAPESAWFKPLEFYSENGIELRRDTRLTALDLDARIISLSDGSNETFGTLVIATGLSPRRLQVSGGDHPKVVTLRDMSDLDDIRTAFGVGRHLVAIGAGFIGLEVAAAAVSAGSNVTVIESQKHALGRVVAPEVAAAIVGRHEKAGVTFRFNETVLGIGDQDGQPVVELASGAKIVADLALVGIGGVPNDGLARTFGIDCDDGILVDETGITSDPHVYAVGDVCRQFSAALGRTVRLESWQNAQNQAIAVGKRIAGAPGDYNELPWFWTDQYDDNFQIIGIPQNWDHIVWRGAPQDDKFTAIYLKYGVVVGGNTFNNARDIRPLKQLILDRTSVEPDDFADMTTSLVKIQKKKAAQ